MLCTKPTLDQNPHLCAVHQLILIPGKFKRVPSFNAYILSSLKYIPIWSVSAINNVNFSESVTLTIARRSLFDKLPVASHNFFVHKLRGVI